MPKTPLQRAAAAQDDDKRKKKARGLISSALALLGLSTDAAAPKAKKSKVIEKYSEKRERMEESDEESDADSAAEEEEEEEATGSTDGGSESTGSSSAEEEEEEEEEGAAEEEEEEARAPAAARGRTVGKVKGGSLRKAYAAADAAFLAAIPEHERLSASVKAPSRLLRYAKKATGQKSVDGVLGALSAMPEQRKATARLAERVERIESTTREQQIEAIVAQAKANGQAPTKDMRASLRTMGAKMGPKFLAGHVATLPRLRTEARTAKIDESGAPVGAPTTDEQAKIVGSIFAGMSDEERAKAEADMRQRLNGAASTTPRS